MFYQCGVNDRTATKIPVRLYIRTRESYSLYQKLTNALLVVAAATLIVAEAVALMTVEAGQ